VQLAQEVPGVKPRQAPGIGEERPTEMAVAHGREAGQEPLVEEQVEADMLLLGQREDGGREVRIAQGTEAGEDARLPEDVRVGTELGGLDELGELLAKKLIVLVQEQVEGAPGRGRCPIRLNKIGRVVSGAGHRAIFGYTRSGRMAILLHRKPFVRAQCYLCSRFCRRGVWIPHPLPSAAA